ncbi:MAG TPA: hypothetical protein VMW16_00055 [Sedimentisphaerales bacterium]|nr:hypothetical protein [Sedimentisphaerales bacterium]
MRNKLIMGVIVLLILNGCAMDRGPPRYSENQVRAAVIIGFAVGYDRGVKQTQMDILGYVPDAND